MSNNTRSVFYTGLHARPRNSDSSWYPVPNKFLRNNLCWSRDKLETEFLRFACQAPQTTLFELFIVTVLTDVDVISAKLQHPVNQQRQLVCGRDDGFRCSQTCAEAAAESAQCASAVDQTLRTQAENIPDAVSRLPGGALQDLSAADFVVGT